MFLRSFVICLLSVVLHSCASVKGSGKDAHFTGSSVKSSDFDIKVSPRAKKPQGKLVVSGNENSSLSSTYFTVLDFTFENDGATWRRVKSVKIRFKDGAANESIKFPVGQDLLNWAESANRVKAIRDYNLRLATGAVIGGGLATGRSSGKAAAVGGGMVLSANTLSAKLASLQSAGTIPKDHLLAGPFSVPPGLHVKKWITLYAEDPLSFPYITSVALEFEYEDNTKEAYVLNFRKIEDHRGSSWQAKHPETKNLSRFN